MAARDYGRVQHDQQTDTGLLAASFGISSPVPMGFNYESLTSGIGYQFEAVLGMSFMPAQTHLQFTLDYDPYSVRNQTSLGINMFDYFGGIQVYSGNYLHSFSSFFTAQIGGVYDWMTVSNASNASANSSMAFAAQVIPGFDLPVYEAFGIVGEMPVKFLFLKSTMVVWSPSIQVRYRF